MLKFIAVLLALSSFSVHAQLDVVGVDDGIDLMPEVDEEAKNREIEQPKQEMVHPELALIAATNQIGSAILRKRLKEKNNEIFRTNQSDLNNMVSEFSRYSQVIDSLSRLYIENSIENGAVRIEPDSEVAIEEDCEVVEGAEEASCEGQRYVAQESVSEAIPFSAEVEGLSEIGAGIEIVSDGDDVSPGFPAVTPVEVQRNIVILQMEREFKKNREKLESLIESGLIEEVNLKGIAMVKKTFEGYREDMNKYLGRINEVNSFEGGRCEIPSGSIEVDCFGTRYALKDETPIGESFSDTVAINDGERAQDDFHFTEEEGAVGKFSDPFAGVR